MGLKMNNNDIYQKTELGRKEVKNQSLGVLPREARTLLIMIDGKKNYQSYVKTLDTSKMFAEFGGIAPLFELLLEFQCIELLGQDNNAPPPTASIKPKAVEPVQMSEPQRISSANENLEASQLPSSAQPQSIQSQASSEAEFNSTFNNPQQKEQTATVDNNKGDVANYESLKSDMATIIEKNAPPEEAWGYLLNLEQCEDATQLLALAQKIQSASSGNLSRSMDKFLN